MNHWKRIRENLFGVWKNGQKMQENKLSEAEVNEVIVVASAYISALRRNDITAAYKLLSDASRQDFSEQQYRDSMQNLMPRYAGILSFEFQKYVARNFPSSRPTDVVVSFLTKTTSDSIQIDVALTLENFAWKIVFKPKASQK